MYKTPGLCSVDMVREDKGVRCAATSDGDGCGSVRKRLQTRRGTLPEKQRNVVTARGKTRSRLAARLTAYQTDR